MCVMWPWDKVMTHPWDMDNRQTDGQTGWFLYTPKLLLRGHKDIYHQFTTLWNRGCFFKYNNTKRSIPAHPTFINDANCEPRLQWSSSSLYGEHVCQVWWRSTQRLSLYHAHKLISIYVHCDPELWPVTSKIKRVYSLTMVNMHVCKVWWRSTQ